MLTVVHGDFEWDADEAARNIAKHGVSFEEAASAMRDPLSQDFSDGLQPMPAVLLAFANDWLDDRRHLRRLFDESKALAPVAKVGLDVLPAFHNATVGDVIRASASARIRLLRFAAAGMASPKVAKLERGRGARTTRPVDADGVVDNHVRAMSNANFRAVVAHKP